MPLDRVVINRDLLKIKDLVCRREMILEEHKGISTVPSSARRIGETETMLRMRKSRGATVFRRKKQIAYVVKKNGKVSSTLVAKELGISRNRANEYLKEMERTELLRSKKNGKVVLYESKVNR